MALVHLEEDGSTTQGTLLRAGLRPVAEPDNRDRDERTQRPEPVIVTPPELLAVQADIATAEKGLKKAVASKKQDAITEAMQRLEDLRTEAMRIESRHRELRDVETQVKKEKAEAKQRAAQKRGVRLEAEIKAEAFELRFPASRGRVAVVSLAGTHLVPALATETVRRITHQICAAYADAIMSARVTGRKPKALREWLDPILASEAGLAPALHAGVLRIETTDAPDAQPKKEN